MNKHLKDWDSKGHALQKRKPDHRQIAKKISDPVNIQLKRLSKLKRASKRSAIICLKTSLVFLGLAMIVLGGLYAMISRGPVSMTFLVEPIEKAINREVQGVSVDIDDAVVQKVENGYGIVFRLKNIRVKDENQKIIAQAPSAGIGLSIKGLFSGRIAPKSVAFIGPEIHLSRSHEGGLGIAFSGQDNTNNLQTFGSPDASQNQSGAVSPIKTDAGSNKILSDTVQEMMSTVQAQQVDMIKFVYQTFKAARQSQTTSSYLSSFGVRDTKIVMHTADGKQTVSYIPDIEIDLNHKGNSSTLVAKANVDTASGPWTMELQAEQNQDNKQLVFKASVENLVAQSLSQYFPDVEFFKKVTIPISGQANFALSENGELQSAETKFQLGAGTITFHPDHPDPDKKRRYAIDEGELHLRYVKGADKVEVLPSYLKWGESRATLTGGFQTVKDQKGVRFWQFDLQARDAVIASEEFNIQATPLDKWVANGFVNPEQGRVILKQFRMETAGAFINLAGEIVDAKDSPEIYLKGQFSPMDIATFKQLWPRFAAPGARKWVGERLTKASILGGNVDIAIPAGLLAKTISEQENMPDNAVKLDISFADGEVYFVTKLPPISAPQGRARLQGQVFTVEVPQGQINLPSGETVMLSNGLFKIPDLRPEPPVGQISFKTESSAQAVLQFLDLDPLGYLKEANFNPSMVSGTTQGVVEINLPLIKDVKFSDLKLKGDIKLTKAEFPNLVDKMSIKDGSINFDLTEQNVHANGFVLLNGVKTQIDWQRIFKAPGDQQPPIRLKATLNSESLEKLGLPGVGDMVEGDIPITATMQKTEATSDNIQFQADLTKATLNMGRFGWQKDAGKRTELEFELSRVANAGTELRNIRVIGDDVSIEGNIKLNDKGEVHEVSLPQFNTHGGTKLVIKGKRQDKIWKVNAEGVSFDGRHFFKSFASSLKFKKASEEDKDATDLELTVKIKDVRGNNETNIRDFSITMKRQNQKLTQLQVEGVLGRNQKVAAELMSGKKASDRMRGNQEIADQLRQLKNARVIVAEVDNIGIMARVMGFTNIENGQGIVIVNLDVDGAVEQQGMLMARNFRVLGGAMFQDLILNSNDNPGIMGEETRKRGSEALQRERLPFNALDMRFKTGPGQLVIEQGKVEGPPARITFGGKIDFERDVVDVTGTFVPLPGLSDIIGIVPIIGFIATNGGEGVMGAPFYIQGSMDNLQLQYNPITPPGVFREPFKFNGSEQEITPR